tara:strand:+ start:414 stop:623 length:210 start_codon:yes stop_codon:yes gene_type:complete
MNYADNYSRLAVVFIFLATDAINGFKVGLDPALKNFIGVVLILGPLSILALVFFLKRIEKEEPGRIRWK